MNSIEKSNPFSCPSCGFRIFNRRHPQCERCGVQLPAGLVYSEAERQALQDQEREEALAQRRRQHHRSDGASGSGDGAGGGGFDDGGDGGDGGGGDGGGD